MSKYFSDPDFKRNLILIEFYFSDSNDQTRVSKGSSLKRRELGSISPEIQEQERTKKESEN